MRSLLLPLCSIAAVASTASAQTLNVDNGNSPLTLGGAGTSNYTAVNVGQGTDGTLNLADTHALNTGTLYLGNSDGVSGTINQTGGTLTATGQIRVAHWPNETSVYNMTGGSLISSGGLFVGWDGIGDMDVTGAANVNASGGTTIWRNSDLNIAGDAIFSTSIFRVGDGPRGNGTLNIGGNATVTSGTVSVGDANGAGFFGVVNQTGGNWTNTGSFLIGHWPNETSTYNMSGGVLNLTGTNPAAEQAGTLTLGIDGTGILNHSGGTITAEGLYLDARGATGGTDQYNLTGGVLQLRDGGLNGNANTSTYQVNLGGGTIQALENLSITTPATLTGTNGRTTINTGGNTVTITNTLTGGGGLDTEGAVGTVNVTGSGTYNLGDLNVGEGTFSFSGAPTVTAATVNVGHNFTVGAGSGSNLAAILNISGGTYTLNQLDLGNNNAGGVTVNATVNQTGGDITLTPGGKPDGAAVRIGHWPTGTGFYNLSGGTLTIQGGNALSTAIDGTGTFYQTGGTANADRVEVNSRTGGNGNGTFTVEGGTFVVGAGGLVNEGTGPAAVNVGGSGGTLAASANWASSLNMTLSGAGANAATFDTAGNNIALSGVLTGAGGLNKAGAGTLTLTNNPNYTGATEVNGGTLAIPGTGSILATSSIGVATGATLMLNGGAVSTLGVFGLDAGGFLDLNTGGSFGAGDSIWGGTILDSTGLGDATFTEGDGLLASSATAILDLDAPGDVFDLAGGADFTLGTLDGFSIYEGSVSPAAVSLGPNMYEMLLVNASAPITGNFSSWLFGAGTPVASVADVNNGYDFFIEARGNQLFLVAAVPEPSRALLLVVGFGAALLRRRRSVN